MMKTRPIFISTLSLIICLSCSQKEEIGSYKSVEGEKQRSPEVSTFTIKTVEGVKHVRNHAPLWGVNPRASLSLEIKIGGVESKDEELSFYKPSDIALDSEGNLFVLDSGNHRIQKISRDGSFLVSIGQEGQGPGEFQFMSGMSVSGKGIIFITDLAIGGIKVLSSLGDELKSINTSNMTGKLEVLSSGEMAIAKSKRQFRQTGLKDLVGVFSQDGHFLRGIGQETPYENANAYRYFNRIFFTMDSRDNIFIAYNTRNRVEKYTSSGELIISFDRPLNYTVTEEIIEVEKQVGTRKIKMPQVNFVSAGMAIDEKNRIWVLSYDRQLAFEEMGITIAFADRDGRYEGSETIKTSESTKTDAYVFHVFNSEGHFLGKIPLTHHGSTIRIFKDKVYVLENLHDMCVYVYRIVESLES